MFDEKLTTHLAELSKLSFNDDELKKMTEDMTEIAELMDRVQGFNENINPYTVNPTDYNELRNDNHNKSYSTESILKNADKVKDGSFVVPKVV